MIAEIEKKAIIELADKRERGREATAKSRAKSKGKIKLK